MTSTKFVTMFSIDSYYFLPFFDETMKRMTLIIFLAVYSMLLLYKVKCKMLLMNNLPTDGLVSAAFAIAGGAKIDETVAGGHYLRLTN